MSVLASSSGGVGGGVFLFLLLAGYLLSVLPLMGVFGKAGQPGWAAFVPIYNLLILLKVVGRPWWWLLLYLIPVVDIIIAIIVWYDLAKSFRRGVGFTVGLVFLSWIFLLILWLGSDTYQGAAGPDARTVA